VPGNPGWPGKREAIGRIQLVMSLLKPWVMTVTPPARAGEGAKRMVTAKTKERKWPGLMVPSKPEDESGSIVGTERARDAPSPFPHLKIYPAVATTWQALPARTKRCQMAWLKRRDFQAKKITPRV
jgi:hypothetical protein